MKKLILTLSITLATVAFASAQSSEKTNKNIKSPNVATKIEPQIKKTKTQEPKSDRAVKSEQQKPKGQVIAQPKGETKKKKAVRANRKVVKAEPVKEK